MPVTGKEAVDKFTASEKGYYELIIMDIMMPVMNGLEAAHAIRTTDHPDHKKIPIIAISANAFDEDIRRCSCKRHECPSFQADRDVNCGDPWKTVKIRTY